jgi:hypothetical protein
VGLVPAGVGVGAWEGDAVGATVGCGVLVLVAGLVGVIREVGVGVAGEGDEDESDLAGAVDRTGGGAKVGCRSGLTYR